MAAARQYHRTFQHIVQIFQVQINGKAWVKILFHHHRCFGIQNIAAGQPAAYRFIDEFTVNLHLSCQHHRFRNSSNIKRHNNLVGQFVAFPDPMSPVLTTDPAIVSMIGRQFWNVSSAPPAITAMVPSIAFGSPPLTGASRKPISFPPALCQPPGSLSGQLSSYQ